MHETWTSWWNITTGWEKSLAIGLILTLTLDILRMIFWQGSAQHVILWAALTYTALGMIYYQRLWHKHEPAAVLGAKLAYNLHIFGDHIIQKKEGGEFTIVPLGTGRSDTATRGEV